MTSHTNEQPATTQEKKRKVAGAYHPCCDTLTVLTWNVMGSTTVPDELMQIAQQRKPWIIVLTETKLTDARRRQSVLSRVLTRIYTVPQLHQGQ